MDEKYLAVRPGGEGRFDAEYGGERIPLRLTKEKIGMTFVASHNFDGGGVFPYYMETGLTEFLRNSAAYKTPEELASDLRNGRIKKSALMELDKMLLGY